MQGGPAVSRQWNRLHDPYTSFRGGRIPQGLGSQRLLHYAPYERGGA